MPGDGDRVAAAQATLRAFVLRARRVVSHSFFGDEARLVRMADGGMSVTVQGADVSVDRLFLPEEALESLAARVRPLTLQGDPVHYDSVLNALSLILHRAGRSSDVQSCKALKKDWRAVDPHQSQATYFLVHSSNDPALERQEITDRALSMSWFYGDLVHATTESSELGARFGINERFAAASVRVAELAILTKETLEFVLAVEGLPGVDLELGVALEAEVVANGDLLPLESAVLGPPGAHPGSPDQSEGGPWIPISADILGGDGTRDIVIPWGAQEE